MTASTIPGRLFELGRKIPERPAYHERIDGRWQATPWSAFAKDTRRAAHAMLKLGLGKGGAVCVFGFNRPEWVTFHVAAMAAGGVSAGIYTTCSPDEVAYIAGHCEAKLILVEDLEKWSKVEKVLGKLPGLAKVVTYRSCPAVDHERVLSWEAFLALGDGGDEARLDEIVAGLKPDDLGTLIYTSGTTGPPKGVMLSHRNLAWTADCANGMIPMRPDDCSVSYLPLSHIAEQMFTVYLPMTTGAQVYYAESMEKLKDNLIEVQPTVIFGVPRVWEKFHAGVAAKLGAATGLKAKILAWARGVSGEVAELRNHGGEPSGWLAMKYALAGKLVFKKFKPLLGLSRARVCVSGAAPIPKEVLDFFKTLDVMIHEVYGQSEGTGPTSFNLPGKTRIGSVGMPIPGCEVKIAPDEEILVRGPNVFLGYYKEPQATAETLIDGWLHSGDLGKFTDEGYLTIIGRKKEIIITSGGKNITPKNIEEAIKHHPLVAEPVLVGDRRNFITALVTLDPDAAAKYATEHGIPLNDLHDHAAIRAEVQKAIDAANEQFARVEQVRKFTILPAPFSIEGGELTPTMKIKRKKVYEKYSAQIEAMYAEPVRAD